jgi:hypothetical protein
MAAIGIASDVKIWKLCYEINRVLGLLLRAEEENPPTDDLLPTSNISPNLFQQHPSPEYHELSPELYIDGISESNREYRLRFLKKSQLPQPAKSFAYFLLIKFDPHSPPEMQDILYHLNQSDWIVSAIDCSHLQQLKLYWL